MEDVDAKITDWNTEAQRVQEMFSRRSVRSARKFFPRGILLETCWHHLATPNTHR